MGEKGEIFIIYIEFVSLSVFVALDHFKATRINLSKLRHLNNLVRKVHLLKSIFLGYQIFNVRVNVFSVC